MSVYGYEAIDPKGKKKKGSIDAESEREAKQELKKQGFFVTSLTPQSSLTKSINIDISGKPKARDLAVFCRQFAAITRSGVPIIDAMKMMADSTKNVKLKKALIGVKENIQKGETFAVSLKLYPDIFPESMVNMVAAGEASGSLDTALERSAVQMERAAHIKALVKKASIYPIVLLVVCIVVIVVMLMFVIPSYTTMFSQLDTELPQITQAVVAMSDWLQAYWFIALPILVAIVVAIRMFSKSDKGKHFFGKLALKIPVFRNFTEKNSSALFARTLSTLLGAGVPIVEALTSAAKTMKNVYFKEAVEDARESVKAGTTLAAPLIGSGVFPLLACHMIKIGEESGNIESMLDKTAEYYEEETEEAIKSLMALMEPLIIIVLAGIVGVLIASVMAPMLTMYDALDSI